MRTMTALTIPTTTSFTRLTCPYAFAPGALGRGDLRPPSVAPAVAVPGLDTDVKDA